MRCVSAILCFLGAVLNFTQPLWVDDTPIYPPIIGVLVFGPLCLFGLIVLWRAER